VKVLGVNSFFEHPAAALVVDGQLLFAAEDERFTGVKHGRRYSPHRTYVPVDAIAAALRFAGMTAADLDEIASSYSRWRHLHSLGGCLTGRRISPLRDELAAFGSLVNWGAALRTGYEIPERHRDVLDPAALGRVHRREWDHHLSHAASAFYCSSFPEALTVVSDGAGEADSLSVFHARGRHLRRIARMRIPHSLGLFYSHVTRHLGFEPFSDEYKVMGLAAYGEPRYADALASALTLRDGGYALDLDRLGAQCARVAARRRAHEPLEQVHRDLARSAQARLETVLEHVVRHYARATGAKRLCLAGGTFLNCVANGRIAQLGLFDEIYVQPAASDAGTAIGAAGLSSVRGGGPAQLGVASMALGTAHEDDAVARVLDAASVAYKRLAEDTLREHLTRHLARGHVCAVFRGRMEFGPRALGMRSLLASPREAAMRDRLNRIKGREGFRPVAPLVAAERFGRYFDGHANRYMLFTARVRPEMREAIPAAVHVDGTARVQAVAAEHDPFLHGLLGACEREIGHPVLINTSLNTRGKPIVETPHEALACYLTTDVDCMAIGSFLLEKRAAA
jgi:carbamoyltransferase